MRVRTMLVTKRLCSETVAVGEEDRVSKMYWQDKKDEDIQGSSLSLESVDNVEGCDGLSLGVLGVCDGVADDVWRGEDRRLVNESLWP